MRSLPASVLKCIIIIIIIINLTLIEPRLCRSPIRGLKIRKTLLRTRTKQDEKP
jgi:hypothetical protein